MSWENGFLNAGDIWMFGCALSYAVYILILDSVTQSHTSIKLTAVQMFTVTILGLFWAISEFSNNTQIQAIDLGSIGIVLYLGVIATAGTTWTQAVAQKRVSAYDTSIMYTLEPVFALVFSFLWLDETLGLRGLFGAVLILSAMVIGVYNVPRKLDRKLRDLSDS